MKILTPVTHTSTEKAPPLCFFLCPSEPHTVLYHRSHSIIGWLIYIITSNVRITTASNDGLNILIYFFHCGHRLVFMKVRQSTLPKEVFRITNCLCLQIHTSAKQIQNTTPRWSLPHSLAPAGSRRSLLRVAAPRKFISPYTAQLSLL